MSKNFLESFRVYSLVVVLLFAAQTAFAQIITLTEADRLVVTMIPDDSSDEEQVAKAAAESAAMTALFNSLADAQLPELYDGVFDASGYALMDELYLLLTAPVDEETSDTYVAAFEKQADDMTYLLTGLWSATQELGNSILEGKDGKKLYFSGEVTDAWAGSGAESEGFFLLKGDENEAVDVYFHNFKVHSVQDKTEATDNILGVIKDLSILGESLLLGMASPFAVAGSGENIGSKAFRVNFHVRGDNLLTGGAESRYRGQGGKYKVFADVFYMVSSPIAVRPLPVTREIDGNIEKDGKANVANKACRLFFDDEWLVSASSTTTTATNGALDLALAGNYSTPAIDLGNSKSYCEFNGGRYTFATSASNSAEGDFFYVSSMSICYKEASLLGFTFLGVSGSISPSEGGVMDANVLFNDGTFTTHSAEELVDAMGVDVVKQGWYYDYTDLRLPMTARINGGTFTNCYPYRCSEAAEPGYQPKDTDGEQLKAYTIEKGNLPDNGSGEKENSNGTLLESVVRDYLDTELDYWTTFSAKTSRSLGLSSLTPDESDKITLFLPYLIGEDDKESENKQRNYTSLIPLMGALGLYMGGNQEVLTDGSVDNCYLFYAQLSDYTKTNAGVSLACFDLKVEDAMGAHGKRGDHEFSSISNPNKVNSDSNDSGFDRILEETDVTNLGAPEFKYGLYSMLSYKSNVWYTICPPYDVHHIYVFQTLESLDAQKAEELKIDKTVALGSEEYLVEQGKADGVLAQGIITSLLPSIMTGEGSGVRMKLTDIARNTLNLEPLEIITYNPKLAGHDISSANFYLYEMKVDEVGSERLGQNGYLWTLPEKLTDFSAKWELVEPQEASQTYKDQNNKEITSGTNIWMKKGHIYCIYLPSSKSKKYWDGKYLVFEGYGPQTLSTTNKFGNSSLFLSSADMLNLMDDSFEEVSDAVAMQGNYTMANFHGETVDGVNRNQVYMNKQNDAKGLNRYDFERVTLRRDYDEAENDISVHPWDVYMVMSETNTAMYEKLSDLVPLSVTPLPATNPVMAQTTDVQPVSAEEAVLSVWQYDGLMIHSFVEQAVAVYGIAGNCIWNGILSENERLHLPVEQGVYLVRNEGQTAKIVVE